MKAVLSMCSKMLIAAGLCVTSMSQASSITITVTDDRPIDALVCEVDFNKNGVAEWGVEGPYALNFGKQMQWSITPGMGDDIRYLAEYPYAPDGRQLILVKNDGDALWQDLYVSCNFRIDNAPHVDWEYIGNMTGADVRLELNAWGGTWDGENWVGDFLHHE